jgi:regulator of protease activity HflC (stomatin/prohibitin superfamily)
MRYGEEQDDEKALLFHWLKIGGSILVIIVLLWNTMYIVNAGERGILITLGNPSDIPTSEGLHFKIPFVQTVVIMDVKTQKYESESSAASSDLQTITTKIALNYHLTPETVPLLYKEIGIGYQDIIVQPAEQESIKAITAQFTAEDLIVRREEVRQKMKELLIEKLQPRGLVITEVQITNFDFSESFNDAIEQKVTALQLKLKAQNDLERIKIEAEQTVAKAGAEAEALRLKKQSITPELVQLSQIEVQSKALDIQKLMIEKWNGVSPTTLVSGQSGFANMFSTGSSSAIAVAPTA